MELAREENKIGIGYCDLEHPVQYPPKDYDYSGMKFSSKDLTGLSLRNICFSHCDFRNANFDRADLEDADLNNCNLSGATFRRANLRGCNLEMSKTIDTVFEGSYFDRETHLPFSHEEALEKGMIFKVSLRDRFFELKKLSKLRKEVTSKIQLHSIKPSTV